MVANITADLASIFDTGAGEFAETASYTPAAGGSATSVAVIVEEPVSTEPLGPHGLSARTRSVLVLASVVADPRGGSTWTLRGAGYTCHEAALSDDGKQWQAWLEPTS